MLDMLACMKLIQEKAGIKQTLYEQQLEHAHDIWQKIVTDPVLQADVTQQAAIFFNRPIDFSCPASPQRHYALCGIDGSQIYPDRHEGFFEYLINIGMVDFVYAERSIALLETKPFLLLATEQNEFVTADYVNAQRALCELQEAQEQVKKNAEKIIIFDGTLTFWQLQPPAIQKRFLPDYRASFQDLQVQDSTYMGYVSASQARDLVGYIALASKILGQEAAFDCLVDTDIAQFFLSPGKASQVFNSAFIYLHGGDEIARVEVPGYIADNDERVARCIGIVFDQIVKGQGYPVALAQAHEQAVIKGPDREFFYTMLQGHYVRAFGARPRSLKLQKKRFSAV